jgi:biotin carboxyl carrier protein
MQNFRVTVNGKVFEVVVEETSGVQESGAKVVMESSAAAPAAPPAPAAPAPAAASAPKAATLESGDKTVNAPLAGTIMSIKVKPGQAVKFGQVLLTLEALKMENEIVAPEAGTIKEILVNEGTSVNVGDVMITIRS